MPIWILVALAGAAGTLSRWGLGELVRAQTDGHPLPWHTIVVNAVGCFAFGVVAVLADELGWLDPQARAVVLVGFMGAFTTFSTFGHDTYLLWREHHIGMALANIGVSVGVGVAMVVLGIVLTRQVVSLL